MTEHSLFQLLCSLTPAYPKYALAEICNLHLRITNPFYHLFGIPSGKSRTDGALILFDKLLSHPSFREAAGKVVDVV